MNTTSRSPRRTITRLLVATAFAAGGTVIGSSITSAVLVADMNDPAFVCGTDDSGNVLGKKFDNLSGSLEFTVPEAAPNGFSYSKLVLNGGGPNQNNQDEDGRHKTFTSGIAAGATFARDAHNVSNAIICWTPTPTSVQPEPEPERNPFVRATFICIAEHTGPSASIPGGVEEGRYYFRIGLSGDIERWKGQWESTDRVSFTAGVGGSGLFSGSISRGEELFWLSCCFRGSCGEGSAG